MNSIVSSAVGMDRAKKPVALAAMLASGLVVLVGGCDSAPESHVVAAPPPAAVVASTGTPTVVVTPSPTYASSPVIVTQAPPVLQTEVVTVQPSSDHKWIP